MAHRARNLLLLALAACLTAAPGCSMLLPQTAEKPVIRNPFPQLSRVAIAPFFNQSDEPTVNGRDVAMAYYAELQGVRGFEVIPVGVVEEAIIAHRVDLSGPGEARRLAQILEVDAVIVGSVTDYSPYYPPRVGLRVEWYAANPGFHEIPAGYGLPFGTPEEEFIPDDLAYEAELAAAKAELAAKSPDLAANCEALPALPLPVGAPDEAATSSGPNGAEKVVDPTLKGQAAAKSRPSRSQANSLDPFESQGLADLGVQLAAAEEELPTPEGEKNATPAEPASPAPALAGPAIDAVPAMPLPGAIGTIGACPPTVAAEVPLAACSPHFGPVMSHTKIYRGDDADVTQALRGYAFFRDDRRIGGWESYLRRSEDFTRFCCHLHISEMLSARGGSRKSQLLWRWPEGR